MVGGGFKISLVQGAGVAAAETTLSLPTDKGKNVRRQAGEYSFI